jgi:flagellar protein FliJ
MARFNFRLQTLRRLREIHRDEQRARLATAFEAERILSAQREALIAETAALVAAQRTSMTQGSLDVNSLLTSQRYRMELDAQLRILQNQAANLAEEIERRRQSLVEADREVRILDKLEERKRQQHREEALRTETKVLDEVASTRWKAAEL